VVSGVTYAKDQCKVTIKGVPDQPGIAAKIFCALADESLSVDVIIQNVSAEGHTDISFTLPSVHLDEAMRVTQRIAQEVRATDVSADSDIVKVSIVGAGMRSHAGVAARMFKVLSREGINIIMISTSEIRVSCIINQQHLELAVRALHDEFQLGDDAQAEKPPSAIQDKRKAM